MKKRKGITDRDVEVWLSQGLGQGEGNDFKPALRVQDVPSDGEGWEAPVLLHREREHPHQFLSRLEMTTGFVYDWLGAKQIREQYAVLSSTKDRSETIEIADRLGIRHPCYRGTRTNIIVTTDMVVTMPGNKAVAVYCKPRALLDPATAKGRRNIEKRSIEEIYWSRRPNTTFEVVDEFTYPEVLKQNLCDVRGRLFQFEHDHLVPREPEAVRLFMACWSVSRCLHDILCDVIAKMGLLPLQAANLVYRAVWYGRIPVKLAEARFHPNQLVRLK